MATTYQIFVKILDGSTRCIQIPCPSISGEALKRDLLAITGTPLEFQRLVTGSRTISDETLISASTSCSLLLRLRGGKGGFGSLLRGAATKAGQKKTNNFDACRDMSGRRLRHVNAEKKLMEWKAEAGDRKLEKLAEQFLKKKAKEVKKNSSVDVEKYLDKYREDAAKCMEKVEESVRESFELYKDNKRKILPTSEQSTKRLKIWLGKNKMDESDSEEEDDDDSDAEKSVVLDGGNCLKQNREEGGTMASGLVSSTQSDGESSGGGSDQSNLEEVDGLCDMGSLPTGQGSENGDANSESSDSVEGAADESVPQGIMGPRLEVVQVLDEFNLAKERCFGPELVVIPSLKEVRNSDQLDLTKENRVEAELLTKEPVAKTTSVSDAEEPLNFDTYNSVAELEVLGMERLKLELQTRGLKCGGTLQERAARLFLLKATPLDKLPKKLLAKPTGGGK